MSLPTRHHHSQAHIMDVPATTETISDLSGRSLDVLASLRSRSAREDGDTRQPPRFPITRAAELAGRTSAAIREAEKDGRIPTVDRTPSGRRVGYTLGEVNQMRAVFGTRPWRVAQGPISVVAVQNFKGGVGKSTVSAHLAQYLAIKGYRACLINCDSQGSRTSMFGYVPDLDITEDDTLYSFFRNVEMTSLAYGLYLIPANLKLYSAEYELAARIARAEPTLLNRIAEGIASIAEHFDIIVLDPPPSRHDFLVRHASGQRSTGPNPSHGDRFCVDNVIHCHAVRNHARSAGEGLGIDLQWMRMMAMRAHEQKSMQRKVRNLFGQRLLRTVLKGSAESDNASARLMSVYELGGPVTSRETHARCLIYLNTVNAEVETQIRLTWPSHARRLRAEGAARGGVADLQLKRYALILSGNRMAQGNRGFTDRLSGTAVHGVGHPCRAHRVTGALQRWSGQRLMKKVRPPRPLLGDVERSKPS